MVNRIDSSGSGASIPSGPIEVYWGKHTIKTIGLDINTGKDNQVVFRDTHAPYKIDPKQADTVKLIRNLSENEFVAFIKHVYQTVPAEAVAKTLKTIKQMRLGMLAGLQEKMLKVAGSLPTSIKYLNFLIKTDKNITKLDALVKSHSLAEAFNSITPRTVNAPDRSPRLQAIERACQMYDEAVASGDREMLKASLRNIEAHIEAWKQDKGGDRYWRAERAPAIEALDQFAATQLRLRLQDIPEPEEDVVPRMETSETRSAARTQPPRTPDTRPDLDEPLSTEQEDRPPIIPILPPEL